MMKRLFLFPILVALFACESQEDVQLDNNDTAKVEQEPKQEPLGYILKDQSLPPNVTVAGKIDGGFGSSLVLETNTSNGVLRITQGFTDMEGNYVLKGNIEGMGLYQLRIEEKLVQGQEPKLIPLTLEIEDSVYIVSSFDVFNATPVYKNTRWAPVLTGYMEELKKFVDWQKTITNPQSYDRETLMKMVVEAKKSSDNYSMKQIEKQPSNPANIVLMSNLFPNMGFEYWDVKQLKALQKMHKGFEAEFPEHPMTISVGAQIAELERSYNEYVAFVIDGIAPEIEMADPKGKIRKLSDLRGKYVLIDFWASWCGPCRMENPNVVRLYNQYKNKNFDIFSVSLDDNKGKWEQAIVSDNLSWENHVSDLLKWQSPVVELYRFQGIPHTVLVDPKGKIVGQNLRGPALEQKLKELLDK
jgi:thiol-disulfide isomerase/thioredoxin